MIELAACFDEVRLRLAVDGKNAWVRRVDDSWGNKDIFRAIAIEIQIGGVRNRASCQLKADYAVRRKQGGNGADSNDSGRVQLDD